MQELAVGDRDVLAGRVRTGRVDDAALDGNIVVADIGVDVVDDHVRGTERIDRVGVGRVLRSQDPGIADDHVVGVIRHDLPTGRVLDGDALHSDVLAVVEDNEAGAKLAVTHYARLTRSPRLNPPALAVAVATAAAP